jgi:hypothetical protein
MRDEGYAVHANLSELTGGIVARRLATLHELQTVYSLEDALNMSEVITVRNYNEWAATEAVKRR